MDWFCKTIVIAAVSVAGLGGCAEQGAKPVVYTRPAGVIRQPSPSVVALVETAEGAFLTFDGLHRLRTWIGNPRQSPIEFAQYPSIGSAGSLVSERVIGEGDLMNAVFSGDGRYLATVEQNLANIGKLETEFSVWEVATGKAVVRMAQETPSVAGYVALSPDGHFAALRTGSLVAGSGKCLRVWDLEKREEITLPARENVGNAALSATLDLEGEPMVFSADGRTLLTPSERIDLRTRDRKAALLAIASDSGSRAVELAVTEDGKWTAVRCSNGRVQIYEQTTRHLIHELDDANFENAAGMAFSDDGKVLAVGGRERTTVVDVTSGKAVALLRHSSEADHFSRYIFAPLRMYDQIMVWPVIFPRQGGGLWTGDVNGTITGWNLPRWVPPRKEPDSGNAHAKQ